MAKPNHPRKRGNASPAVLAPVDVGAGFSDQSTASPEEKARRVLANMAARYSPLFFDDGFPRDVLHTDALAAKRVFEQLAADLAAANLRAAGLSDAVKLLGQQCATLRQRAEAAEADAAGARALLDCCATSLRLAIRRGHHCEATTAADAVTQKIRHYLRPSALQEPRPHG